ncbi:MAG: AAA family ATPase, partial [Firmicutes bacterium]|nr:AAA family ATPase [Bacillota bacterium]
MILKNLEILGYKSFADRVRIEFGCGITGIVGPNGCGKTNLGDALRWVLGEQNPRLLRGQRMEDMLFGGSQGRRSTGLAEVSLTFDNSGGLFPLDLTELSVCRRLYGSGESEYLVNGAACRLKDVLALFYDTGIGRDAYSVFDRPRLEGLIAARPEDRRLFLEEVAGIVKHKNRKREAIRKLEETRQALVRLGDILKELELQLEPLRRQAEAARDFRTLRDEMQSLERSTVLSDLTGLRRQVNLFQEKEADIGARREVLKASLGALTETLTHTRSQEGKVSTELETRGEAISRLGALLQKAGARLELAKQSEARLHGEQERRQAEEETFSRRLEGIREAAAEAESALAATGTELEALQAEIPGMSREIEAFHRNLAESSREIEGLKVDLFDLLRTESSLRNQASQAKGQLEAMERRTSALARSESEAAQRLAAARKKREELDGRVKDAVAKAQSLRTLLAEGSAAAAGKEQRLGEITAEIQDLRSKLAHAESKLAALDELARDQEGYPEGARALLASGKASIQGTLADLLKVPADLEEAVAAALGDAVKYILVNDAEEALPLLAWLRDEDRGRATVFPLSCLQEGRRPVSSEAEPRLFPGLVGRAAELAGRDTSPALR